MVPKKRKLVPVVEIKSASQTNHSIISFRNELIRENGFITLYPSIHDVYPPKQFRYITDFIYTSSTSPPDPSFLISCTCASGCKQKTCDCIQTNPLKRTMYRNKRLASNQLEECIIECNHLCQCDLACPNRVVQLGVRLKIGIHYIPNKGWSVFADQFIPKGSFISQYLGELITQEEAKDRERKYIEKKLLPYIFDMDFYSKNIKEDQIPKKELRSIDAQYYGNISRFFNHSCSPNLFTLPVFYDSAMNYTFTRIAFFTNRDIQKGEELCFDYEGRISQAGTLENGKSKGEGQESNKRRKVNASSVSPPIISGSTKTTGGISIPNTISSKSFSSSSSKLTSSFSSSIKSTTKLVSSTTNATSNSTSFVNPLRFECKCGAPNCRGTIF